MKTLDEQQLYKLAPSIFAESAHEKTSSKYALIPTIECVRGLQSAGFYPVVAQENRCRNADNKPYAKHMIRFWGVFFYTYCLKFKQIITSHQY